MAAAPVHHSNERKVWLGNIPLDLTEGALIQHIYSLRQPTPWKALVRLSASGRAQNAVATMETVEDANRLIATFGLRWPGGEKIVARPVYDRVRTNPPRAPPPPPGPPPPDVIFAAQPKRANPVSIRPSTASSWEAAQAARNHRLVVQQLQRIAYPESHRPQPTSVFPKPRPSSSALLPSVSVEHIQKIRDTQDQLDHAKNMIARLQAEIAEQGRRLPECQGAASTSNVSEPSVNVPLVPNDPFFRASGSDMKRGHGFVANVPLVPSKRHKAVVPDVEDCIAGRCDCEGRLLR